MKILIFTEGTIIMHKGAFGRSRAEIVDQIKDGEESIRDYKSYIPIGDSVTKLRKWQNRGIEILYLTSREKPEEIKQIRNVLKYHKNHYLT